MNFEAAVIETKNGAKVRRAAWPSGETIAFLPNTALGQKYEGAIRRTNADGVRIAPPVSKEDMAADDWALA